MKVSARRRGVVREERVSKKERERARKTLKTLERKYGKSFEAKLKAFDWADDPAAALADLMRKAGYDPKRESVEHPVGVYRRLYTEAFGEPPTVTPDESIVLHEIAHLVRTLRRGRS